ncbi:MAG: DMT family transporter [Bacteroidales bacterium]|nr:DMT family transporter [Bacteroidales bacterium]
MKKPHISIVYALLAIVLWSTIAVAFKIGLRNLSPVQFLFNGVLVSLILFFALIVFQGKLSQIRKTKPKELALSALLGFLNPFLYYVVLLEAYNILLAQIAQPLNYTWPVVLVLLSIPILKQKIKTKNIFAILISFLGVVVISMQGETDLQIKNPIGVVLAVGSSIIWALFWLLSVKDKRDPVIKLFMSFVFAFLFLSFYLFSISKLIIPDLEGLFASIYIGFFEMGFTFLLWLTALKLSPSTDKISNLVFISPFLSLFWINIFLGEAILFSTVIGIVLLILGILLNRFFSREI